ncbi:MAG: hypothetical protein ACR2PI_18650 [Hyphomicrobiaceae bacterium]
MKHRLRFLFATLVACCLSLGAFGAASAQSDGATPSAADIVKRAADYINEAKNLVVEADVAFDIAVGDVWHQRLWNQLAVSHKRGFWLIVTTKE